MEEQVRHGEGEEQLDMVLDMKTFHGCAREEREACARQEEVKNSADSVWTDRSADFETDAIYSYELGIEQMKSRWKDNFKSFPAKIPPALPAKDGRHCRPGGTAGPAGAALPARAPRHCRP